MFGQYDFQGQINKMNEQSLQKKKKEMQFIGKLKKNVFFCF
jgi:hypothetical protein